MTSESNRYHINSSGHLEIGGCDSVELVERFGTPLYVLDEGKIRDRCRLYQRALNGYEPGYRVIYAGKALLTTAICRIIHQEGLGLDVVSGGELYTALHAEFPPERIYFHGNNKSPDELEMAVRSDVHRIVIDNLYELELLERIATRYGKTQNILLRITPGVEADTHAHILTGQEDSKFGLDMKEDAFEAVRIATESTALRLRGVHAHIGSQLMDGAPFKRSVQVIFNFLAQIRSVLGYTAAELNVGGGFGIKYVEGDRPPDIQNVVETIVTAVRNLADQWSYPLPYLMIEPGRSIVGEAGITLYTVGSIKRIPGRRTYVAVDGGMADNPRVALYDAKYDAVVANRMHAPPYETVSIAGKCCESGDMLLWDWKAPQLTAGDILAVLSTGAYNYSMASHYNRLPKPAIVLVGDGEADIIVRRETYEDLLRYDTIPERLRPAQPTPTGRNA